MRVRGSGGAGVAVMVIMTVMTVMTAPPARAADVVVRPDGITALMAVHADRSGDARVFQPGGHGTFFVTGWRSAADRARWTISVPERDAYEVRVLVRRAAGAGLQVSVATASGTVAAPLPPETTGWVRLPLDGTLTLAAGRQEVSLSLGPAGDGEAFSADVQAVEFVRPAARDALAARARALASDTDWLRRARYGVMVHWTRESMPLGGEPRAYEAAVDAFDVDAFAATMARTGAGFVVFTTSHATMAFPAPLPALDRILPGRTTRRDLVADLAAALDRRGLRLVLYFHQGTSIDREWVAASGFEDADPTRFYDHWRTIITEAGERYGPRLAGWWFDDGAVGYYPRNPDWEALERSAKAGDAERLVCFNPWELPSPTDFQDFFAGEGCVEPAGAGGLLAVGGDGRYPSGPYAGLQSTACLTAGGDWVHSRRDTPLPRCRWTVPEITALLGAFAAHGNVPIFNLEITQDGVVPEATVEALAAAGVALAEDADQRPREPGVDPPRN
jgi:hypothetical protein